MREVIEILEKRFSSALMSGFETPDTSDTIFNSLQCNELRGYIFGYKVMQEMQEISTPLCPFHRENISVFATGAHLQGTTVAGNGSRRT